MFGYTDQSNRPVSDTEPPRALPCPPIHLVSELTESEALTLRGRNSQGEVMVLSTT